MYSCKNASRLSNFKYKTGRKLTSIEISEDYILLIVKNLNVDKALEWNNYEWRFKIN